MRRYTIDYLWYDEECGQTMVSSHIVHTMKELCDWLRAQPPVQDIRIYNVYEMDKIQYVPYKSS